MAYGIRVREMDQAMNRSWWVVVVLLLFAACDEPFATSTVRHYTAVTTGGQHTCAIAESGAAYCWGRGVDGELGHGAKENRTEPVRVAGGLRFKDISAGEAHTCGLTVEGRAYCWGWSAFYQLGNPQAPSDREPVPVTSDLTFTAISAGAHHTCALSSESRVYCWGNNKWGQNGDGTVNTTIEPSEVQGNLRAVAISAGAWHSCAITATGVLYCWGRNDLGQVGGGSNEMIVAAPTPVRTSLRFSAVDAGNTHTCAISRQNRAYCWGSNEYGEIGDGAPFREGLAGPATPTAVMLLPEVTHISAGTHHSCAIGTTGLGYCWGRNDYGQLANGNVAHEAVRQPIHVLPTHLFSGDRFLFTTIATGGTTHACGLVEGSIFCWGTGTLGQLGNVNTYATMPQRVAD